MTCIECNRLLAEYGRLKQTYTAALHARIESADAPEPYFVKLQKATEEAWTDAECAMLEFCKHKRSHAGIDTRSGADTLTRAA
jgi:hypothetical protein